MRNLFLLLAGGGLTLLLGAPTAVAQLPPTRVFGTVTVGGQPAPAGTVVQALIGEKVCGEGVVRRISDDLPLGYVVDVAGATQVEGCGTDGATITFRVGGVPANETATFATGTFIRLDLTVRGQVATPTPGAPTPPPFGAAPAATPTAVASPGAASPTPAEPGGATEAPAVATPTATVTAGPGLPVRTATPAGSAQEGGGGGAGRILAAVAALIALAAAGAGAYLWYRRRG
jgi:hypothetical protein